MPLQAVDGLAGVTWRCGACGGEHVGTLVSAVMVTPASLQGPALALACPACGAVECFNTALTAADEEALAPGNHASRAEQARLVRALCRLAGLAVRG